jgi:hypothetical protein
MPGGDRTGPRGGGPKTDRDLGSCTGNEQPGCAVSQTGQRFNRGFPQDGYSATPSPKAAGKDGYCICPDCGHKVDQVTGKLCSQQKCPMCGTHMAREIHPR